MGSREKMYTCCIEMLAKIYYWGEGPRYVKMEELFVYEVEGNSQR